MPPCRIALASLVTLVAGCTLLAPPPRRAPQELRVATFNLNYGLAMEPSTLAAASTTGADVVLLQEASEGWIDSLRAVLHGRFPHECVASSPWPAGGGAILSRYPLTDCARSESPVGWFPALAATAHTPLGAVRLMNVHLQPARGGIAVVEDLVGMPERHRAEIESHLAHLFDPSVPSVIGGDFNETDGGGAWSELAARGYRSALPEHQPAATTWRWQVGAMPLEMRLDHVLYQPGTLRCISARVLDTGRSDHRPLVVAFTPADAQPYAMGSALLHGRTSILSPR